MKKLIPIMLICLAILCFFSSCGAFDPKPLEATYRHYGHITYKDPDRSDQTYRAERCLMSLYPDGSYTIDLISAGAGTWARDAENPNIIILTPSTDKIFSRIELEYDPKYHTLEPIKAESSFDGFEVEGTFRYTRAL